MKALLLAKLCIFLLAVASSGAMATITADEARAAVRAFENKQDLQFSAVTLREDSDIPGWSSRHSYYELRNSSYPDDAKSWKADAATGEVVRAFYESAFTSGSPTDEPFGSFTREQCRQVASSFAASKYSGLQDMGFEESAGTWTGRTWRFDWSQVLACGARGPSGITIEVTPIDGQIMSYSSWRVATFTPSEPQITAEQAVSIAQQAGGITSLDPDGDNAPSLYADPDGIWWQILLQGSNDAGDQLTFAVKIDAVSGQVTGLAPAMMPSLQESKAQPSLAKAQPGSRLVWIREVCKTATQSSIHWHGKSGADLAIAGHHFSLKPGSRLVRWDGGSITLSCSVELKNGRLLVPVDLQRTIEHQIAASRKGDIQTNGRRNSPINTRPASE